MDSARWRVGGGLEGYCARVCVGGRVCVWMACAHACMELGGGTSLCVW